MTDCRVGGGIKTKNREHEKHRVYNRYKYDKEKQQAIEAWEKMLTSIITVDNGKAISETAEDSGNNLLV